MLIEKNGVTRNIDEARFEYYKARGYVKKEAATKEPVKPKQEKGKE